MIATNRAEPNIDDDFVVELNVGKSYPPVGTSYEIDAFALEFAAPFAEPLTCREPPTLPAERLDDGTGRVKVLCRYCSAARGKPSFHFHGEPVGDGTTYRAAPCATAYGIETPYTRSGYRLHVVEPGFYSRESLRRLGLNGGRR